MKCCDSKYFTHSSNFEYQEISCLVVMMRMCQSPEKDVGIENNFKW